MTVYAGEGLNGGSPPLVPVLDVSGNVSAAAPPSAAAPSAPAQTGNNDSTGGSVGPDRLIGIDFPLDGRGQVLVPAAAVLSPVFTMWVTLILVYIGE
jgi:hypothetical protein